MKLAEYQDLYYVKKVDFGVYLAEDMGGETHVLLPSKQVPEDAKPGEKIRVFLYKDCNNQHTEADTGRICTACGERSWKDRCFSGLGTGKRSVSAI